MPKMNVWRLLKPEVGDAFTNMAMDEAILMARIAGKVPNTLRFYRWKPSAVSLGRFQDLLSEVHVENCRKHGIDFVRRITGGGAVYHDCHGEITYSVVADVKDLGCAEMDILPAYKTVCKGLIEAVRILGITAEFNPLGPKHCPNITIKGKKISGSAQSYRKGILLQHGTFLVQINNERMFTFLKVPWARTMTDVIEVAKEKLTSAKKELRSPVSFEKAYQALVRGFEKALEIQLVEEEPTSHERELAQELRKTKFETEDWNLNGHLT
jgi:lipoate-protein ligase A